MTREEFERGWAVLQGALPTLPIPDSTRELYWGFLQDLEGQRYISGILSMVQDTGFDNNMVPTVAEIREWIPQKPDVPEHASKEWREAYFKRYGKRKPDAT